MSSSRGSCSASRRSDRPIAVISAAPRSSTGIAARRDRRCMHARAAPGLKRTGLRCRRPSLPSTAARMDSRHRRLRRRSRHMSRDGSVHSGSSRTRIVPARCAMQRLEVIGRRAQPDDMSIAQVTRPAVALLVLLARAARARVVAADLLLDAHKGWLRLPLGADWLGGGFGRQRPSRRNRHGGTARSSRARRGLLGLALGILDLCCGAPARSSDPASPRA